MAGLLMFGKGLLVRERFDNLCMDYIDKSNLIGDQRYNDRLTYDGTWENNLFNFIHMVIPKLTRDLPRPFSMDGVIRTDDTLQAKAVREAVTNMIIHSDFMLNGVLKVEKYDNCFVLTNSGYTAKSVKDKRKININITKKECNSPESHPFSCFISSDSYLSYLTLSNKLRRSAMFMQACHCSRSYFTSPPRRLLSLNINMLQSHGTNMDACIDK